MKKCCCCGEEVVSGYVVCEDCKGTLVDANERYSYDEDADAMVNDDSYRRGYQSALTEEGVETANDAHANGFFEGFSFCIEKVQEWIEEQGDRISKAKLLKMLGGPEDEPD